MISNPIYGKIKNGNQTTNQFWYAKQKHIYTEVGWCLVSGPFLVSLPLSFPATEARRRSSSWSTRRFNRWWFPSRRHDHSSPSSWFIRDNPIKKVGLGSPHLWKSPSVVFGPGNCSCRMSMASRHVWGLNFRPKFQAIYHQNIAKHMVPTYLHFRILEFPVNSSQKLETPGTILIALWDF